jgi:RNA polymerase sigma-70 factor (ECF subfamily)
VDGSHTAAREVAWGEVRSQIRGFVVRRVSASDVDDVVQEVLVAVSVALPTLRDRERLGPFLHGIARRTVSDHHRRRAREHARLAELLVDPEVVVEEESAAEAMLAKATLGFLPLLSPASREALRAVDLEGRRQSEVARELGVPLSTLRARVQRARAEMRELLRDCCAIELDVRGRVVECEPKDTTSCVCEPTDAQRADRSCS